MVIDFNFYGNLLSMLYIVLGQIDNAHDIIKVDIGKTIHDYYQYFV